MWEVEHTRTPGRKAAVEHAGDRPNRGRHAQTAAGSHDPRLDSEAIASELCEQPVPVPETRRTLPKRGGSYAWWIRTGALPAVPTLPHRTEAGWSLLYIGIAPGRAGSAATLASRIGGQHIGGNTGSSTFRLSLAAFLFESESWVPRHTTTKVVLSAEDNRALRDWQVTNAGLCWSQVNDPWPDGLEAAVIERLKPPLNLAENSAHPFHETMSGARHRFRRSAT